MSTNLLSVFTIQLSTNALLQIFYSRLFYTKHCMPKASYALYELAIVCIIHDHMLYIVTTWAYCCVQFTLETRRGPKDQPTDLPADQPTDRH